jgi:ATP-binding cassette subfamily F protein 3
MEVRAGSKTLYSGVHLVLNPGVKYALIGPNGSGKTTLFRVLTKEMPMEKGTILLPSDMTIGYLPQDIIRFSNKSVWELVEEARESQKELQGKIRNLEERIQSEPENKNMPKWLEQLDHLYHQMNILQINQFEGEAEKILIGLGFDRDDFHKKLHEFSGGWQMRAYLAKLLLMEPDFLLLDEPTNHLDIQSMQWMENFLSRFKGSVIFITHDRYFVDRLAQKILYIHNQTIEEFSAPYEKFQHELEAKFEQIRHQYENQQKKIQEIQHFIDRFRYKATKARQVQSRIKELEKMDIIELQEEKRQTLQFKLHISQPSYKEVLQIRDLWFAYDSEWIIKGFNADVFRGQKIGIVGPNGAGKTTLLKLIAGFLQPVKGEIHVGKRVELGYYAQHQIEQLHLSRTILEEVTATASKEHAPMVRTILGSFLFHDEEQEKKIDVLSGGEKARVALAKLLVRPLNTLILDEPTNHLDIESKEILADALKKYEGTILVVSHDREFLDLLTERIWYISKDHRITEFVGNYSEFYRKNSQLFLPEVNTESENPENSVKKNEDGKKRHEKRKQMKRELQRMEKRSEQLEEKIHTLEKQLKEIEEKLSSGNLPLTEIQSKSQQYESFRHQLEILEMEWIEIQDQIEHLSRDYEKMR